MSKLICSLALAVMFASPAYADCRFNWEFHNIEKKTDFLGACSVNLEGSWMDEGDAIGFISGGQNLGQERGINRMRFEQFQREAKSGKYDRLDLEIILNKRSFLLPETFLTETEFNAEKRGLVSQYGDNDWVFFWDYPSFGWPIQYENSFGRMILVDHKEYIVSAASSPRRK